MFSRMRNLAARASRSLPTYIAQPELVLGRLRDLRRPSTVTFRNVEYLGMTLLVMPNEDIGWRLATGAGFERAELNVLGGLLRPDDVCLDVGGNIGIYATFFARRVPAGQVYSFEPIPLNAGLIEINASLNQCENVTVERCALADFEGTSDFVISADAAYSSFRSTGRVADARVRKVKVTRLDSWLLAMQVKPTVLKIDVEGAELSVLKGAKDLLGDPGRRPRLLMVEVNSLNQAAYQIAPEEIVAYLSAHGYQVHSILQSGAVVPGWPIPGALEDVLFKNPA